MNSVKAKLLLVDDDPDLLRLLSIRLQGAGYAVSAVESAEAALSQVAVSAPDVVITDISMPLLNGLDAVRQIKSNRGHFVNDEHCRAAVHICSKIDIARVERRSTAMNKHSSNFLPDRTRC